tara:strand:- start:5224 stop:5448 length:225 start_codon:yes stop_codon:yes gene_type:complete
MATKDWKIYIKDETGMVGWKVWQNKKFDNDFVEINKDGKGWWASDYQRGFPLRKKRFKTKSKALVYVRAYMRRN